MSVKVSDASELELAASYLNGETVNEKLIEAFRDGVIEFKKGVHLILDKPIVIRRPVRILGNNAVLSGKAPVVFSVLSSNVTISGFCLDQFEKDILIDGGNGKVENIELSDLVINDPGFGVCFNIGSTDSYGTIRNVSIHDCVINSGYNDNTENTTGFTDGAYAFNISAACPDSSRTEDLIGAVVDGVTIKNCKVLGPRRYGINMLVGISIPQPGTDFMSQKAKIVDCSISNVKVLDCEFDYCREMAVTLSGGCINNYGSKIENLEIAGCRVIYGIAGVGFSAAGPIIPTSVSRHMFARHGSIHDNYLEMMSLPVNEPSCAINLTSARSEAFPGVEVYDCFVEDVDIYNNTVVNADQGIQLVAANSMGDLAVELSDNYIKDVRIYNNHLKDVRNPFCFMAAYAEGRRYDWNWGWMHRDFNFAPLSEDHAPTIKFCRNYISDINCHDNDIDGCATEIVAVAGLGRGHAVMAGNRICDNIFYENNHFSRSEGHRNVTGAYYSDWVIDAGDNEVTDILKN